MTAEMIWTYFENEQTVAKKVLNMIVKGKYPGDRIWEPTVKNVFHLHLLVYKSLDGLLPSDVISPCDDFHLRGILGQNHHFSSRSCFYVFCSCVA